MLNLAEIKLRVIEQQIINKFFNKAIQKMNMKYKNGNSLEQ
jgi:hypothetical protein